MSAGVLAVEAAFDVEHRGRNRQREQSDRGTVAGHQGLGELADLLLFEDFAGGVCRGRDERGTAGAGGKQLLRQLEHRHERRAAAVVHVEDPLRGHAEPVGEFAARTDNGKVGHL
jgi:hypothetical protein